MKRFNWIGCMFSMMLIMMIGILFPVFVQAAETVPPVVVTTNPTISVFEWVTTVLVGALVWIFRVTMAKPKWAPYEGMIITAIKMAEKVVPDTSPNKSVAKANMALQEFIRQYTANTGRPVPMTLAESVKQAIPVIHSKLESNGNL